MVIRWRASLKSNVSRSWYICAILPCSGYISARDQSMLESGVIEGRKNTTSFPFREWTQQHKHEASREKATIFKLISVEKQQLVEEKDGDNIRKVLCKSFIQWFWELNFLLLSTKSTVLIRSGYFFFVAVEVKVQKYNKALNVRSRGKPVSFVLPRILMFPETKSRETSGL